MWLSAFQAHRPFPIGRHGGDPEVSPHVKKVVLGLLEADAAAWEDWRDAQGLDDTEENDGGNNGHGHS